MWLYLQYLLFYSALFLTSVFLCVFLYFQFSYTYWARKGVPYIKPKFPLGNNNSVGLGAFSYGIEAYDWYKDIKKKGLKFGGVWSWWYPVLVIVDPEYVKDILVKDFNSFIDRHFFHNKKHDPKNESLFVVEKDEWRNMRKNITPTFTSSKMKMMFDGVAKCTEPMIEYLATCAKNKKDIDVKDVMAAYTMDVIGSNIFGLDLASFEDENSKFRFLGREVFRVELGKGLKTVFTRLWEDGAKYFGIKAIPEFITESFADLVKETIEYRIKNNVKRQDFMQLVIDLHLSSKDGETPFTFDHLVANIIVFFLAGFDTSATTLHYALYELAVHQDLQERARDEMRKVFEKHNGNFSYDTIQDMVYVRQVIEETLRYYPPLNVVARVAQNSYKLKDTNVVIEKETIVVIPTIGLSRDPEYFPDPEHFNPDRFTPENRSSINPYAYIPFGEGPRMCIGKRFAFLQTVTGLVKILQNFKVTLSSSTKLPVKPRRGIFVMAPENNIFLNVERI